MLTADARNKDPLVRAGAKGTIATDHSCCSVATEMVSRKKKRVQILDPRELGCHN